MGRALAWPEWARIRGLLPELSRPSLCDCPTRMTPKMPDIPKGGDEPTAPQEAHRSDLAYSKSLYLGPLILRNPYKRQRIVNKLCDCVAFQNNPLNWWITLLKKLTSTANHERLLRFLNNCPKNRQKRNMLIYLVFLNWQRTPR